MAQMQGGRLAEPQILANTDLTTVYTVPLDFAAMITVALLNRSTNAVTVKIASSDSETPDPAEYIEWSTVIKPRGILERTQILLQPGRRLLVQSATADVVAVTVYGFINPVNRDINGDTVELVEQGSIAP
jgi:hypothetical protein